MMVTELFLTLAVFVGSEPVRFEVDVPLEDEAPDLPKDSGIYGSDEMWQRAGELH